MKEYSTLFIEFLEVTQQMDSANLTLILSTVCFMTVLFKMPAIINALPSMLNAMPDMLKATTGIIDAIRRIISTLLEKEKRAQLIVWGVFSVLLALISYAPEIIKSL